MRRPRWGWRRAAKEARRQARQVNDKRIRRLWRDEGLRVQQRQRKKRLTGIGTHVGAMCPIRPNAVWALDFEFDTLANGRTIKMLSVIDEFTRKAPEIEVDHSIDADRLLDLLALERSGPPAFLRMDNGPELVAHALAGRAGSTTPRACSSIPACRGRAHGSSRSTVASVTSSSTADSSTASVRHA